MPKASLGQMRGRPLFWVLFGLVDLFIILLLLWFFWLGPRWDEILGAQTPDEAAAGAEAVFTLPGEAPYRVTKTFDLLDYHVIRLDHTIHRQGYVVVTGVRRELYDSLLAQGLDPRLVERTANNLMKVREPRNPDELNIENLEITESGSISFNGARVDYQRVRARFHTRKKPEPQSVELISGVLSRAQTQQSADDLTVVVSYGKSGEFQPAAYEAFLKDVTFKTVTRAG